MMTKKAHSIRLARAYVLDWCVVIVLMVGTFLFDRTTPFKRHFSVDDKTISYPFAREETIPIPMLMVMMILCPLILIFLVSVGLRRSAYDFHTGALGLFLALSLTLTVTSALKNTLGRLRPDFLDRCAIRDPNATDPRFKLNTMEICSQTNMEIFEDGMKSFPSGHSSSSFSSMTFLAFYIAGKIHVFDHRGHTWKPFVAIIPLLCAALVAISRVDDYRHHWQDVVVGGLIGMFFGVFAYHQYYPQIWMKRCEKPHSPRVARGIKKAMDLIGNRDSLSSSSSLEGGGGEDHEMDRIRRGEKQSSMV